MRRTDRARRGSLLLVPALALGLLAGCGDDGDTTDEPAAPASATTAEAAPTSTPQGADTSASATDTAATGAATTDTGMTDTGMTDTSMTDTGMTDTGMTDTGMTATTAETTGGDTGATVTGEDTGTSAAAGEAAPIMLQAEDLPTGYSEKPYESENEDCLGPALDAGAAQVYPPNAFEAESVVGEARSRAWTFASPEEAQAAFETATGADIEACVLRGAETDLQTEDFEPGGTAEAQLLELEPLAGADDQAATTYAATFVPAGETEELTAYSNLILVLAGDTVAAYQFLTLQRPFSPADQQKAVAAAVARHGASA